MLSLAPDKNAARSEGRTERAETSNTTTPARTCRVGFILVSTTVRRAVPLQKRCAADDGVPLRASLKNFEFGRAYRSEAGGSFPPGAPRRDYMRARCYITRHCRLASSAARASLRNRSPGTTPPSPVVTLTTPSAPRDTTRPSRSQVVVRATPSPVRCPRCVPRGLRAPE